jgi:opacity protein-like surface antigen
MKSAIRRLISGIAIAGFTHTAFAADPGYSPEFFDPGPALYFNWGGFYFGASGGGGVADAKFGNGAFSLLSSTLITTPLATALQLPSGFLALSPDNEGFATVGGFAGYNTQWESAILGLEVNYHWTSLDASASSSVPTFAIGGTGNVASYNVDASVSSRIRLTDYATIRGRAGWALGNFLPYASLGLAIGRADVTNSARVHFTGVDNFGTVVANVDVPINQIQKNKFAVGYAIGLGVDWMVTSGLFVRAEYEFVEFANFGDRSETANGALVVPIEFVQRNLTMNTVRLGLGYKF